MKVREIYLHRRFFTLLAIGVAASIMAYIYPPLYGWVIAFLVACTVAVMADVVLLFRLRQGIDAAREMADKFSNGEENPVRLVLRNHYQHKVSLRMIDEIPVYFQYRDISFRLNVPGGEEQELIYALRPVQRGAYGFGKLRVFASTRLSLIERRYSFDLEREVAVYPSFMMMYRFELAVLANLQPEMGALRTRTIGGNMAFEHIKPYVSGDDPRSVNWKATAKYNRLMVNEYVEERAQQIYCLADMGRSMQSSFQGMTMLDHVINTILTLSNIILKQGDCAGLITFSHTSAIAVKADNRTDQLNRISEVLYRLQTQFYETDIEKLYGVVIRQIPTRSLLILFTHFETVSAMRRQLPALRQLAKRHLLLLVMFEDVELNRSVIPPAHTLKEIYFKTMATSFRVEKYQMVQELSKAGIHVLLTRPDSLTADTINRYLAVH